MTDVTRRTGRIVVAVDSDNGGDFGLELARLLTEAASPELLGLFVEHVHLLDYARSRLAREITRSGSERPLDRARLERQIRDQSTRAKLRFEQVATRLGLRSTFRVTRGEVASELLEQAAGAEALVVTLAECVARTEPWLAGAVERLVAEGVPVLLFARAGWRHGHRIAVVVEAAEPGTSLHAAARLGRQSGAPLTVLLTARAAADRAGAARRVVEAAGAYGADVADVIAIHAATPHALERAVRLCGVRLLVLPAGVPPVEPALVLELLARLPSALLLVR